MQINLIGLNNMPKIKPFDDLGCVLCESIKKNNIKLINNDIICVASKIVSIAENRIVDLSKVIASSTAKAIHEKIPRKDERIIQLIINEIGNPDNKKLDIKNNYIGCWLQNGLKLTSAGIDKISMDKVALLPKDANHSAERIAKKIYDVFSVKVSVIITDSDGREDKLGANQVAIGLYGIEPFRTCSYEDNNGNKKETKETVCDMLASSAALIIGQRTNNVPAVIIRNFKYDYNEKSRIEDSLWNTTANMQ